MMIESIAVVGPISINQLRAFLILHTHIQTLMSAKRAFTHVLKLVSTLLAPIHVSAEKGLC